MFRLIANFFSASSKAAENHVDYLIKTKQLSELKWGGCVVSAQTTTTNCTAITTQKRTCNTTMLAWTKKAEWNGGRGGYCLAPFLFCLISKLPKPPLAGVLCRCCMCQRLREGSDVHSDSKINNWETNSYGSKAPFSKTSPTISIV